MKKILLFIAIIFINIGSAYAINLVSFGDSIANGYLLSNQDKSYDNMISNTFNFDYYEYSEVGITSDEFLNLVESNMFDEEIKKADIIFINIGSNDFLDIVTNMDLSATNFDVYQDSYLLMNGNFDVNNLLNVLKETVNSEKISKQANEAIINLESNYNKIIKYIRNINEKAEIYAFNLYNPYYNLNNPLVNLSFVSDTFDKYINLANEIFKSDEYHVVDSYNILRNNSLINLDIYKLNFDPHPNKYGHEELYNALLKELSYKVDVVLDDEKTETYYVLKGDTLKIDAPKKNGYTFKEWNHDLNNINDNITVKPIYKKNFGIRDCLLIMGGLISISLVIFVIIKRKRA